MSSDDNELVFFDKYDVSAFKRTIVRVFSTISTPHLILNMSKIQNSHCRHIWNEMRGGNSRKYPCDSAFES